METEWLSYSDLAWTEPILAPAADYAGETAFYVDIIRENSRIEPHTLLHLGCGAGGNDQTLKRHFTVTGVDISDGMLEIARKANPEVTYVHGDMRNFDLDRRFDAVAVIEAIDYMVTRPDLERAVAAACRHLNPGGALLIVAKIREEFRENNFCYTGAGNGIEITVFENNYIPRDNPATCEATLVYLIRQNGRLRIHTDRHKLGLFSRAEWLSVLQDAGLDVRQVRRDGVYEPFILGKGEYPMQVFVGVKPA